MGLSQILESAFCYLQQSLFYYYFNLYIRSDRLLKVQLINVNSKMRKNLFYFLTKKGRTFPLVKISFLKDIDSLGS